MLMSEGGQISLRELITQLIWILAINGALAWAILKGHATVWHLVLPMVGEFVAYLVALPLLQMIYRNAHFKKESWQAVRTLLILSLALIGTLVGRAYHFQQPLGVHIANDCRACFEWIVGAHIQWAILIAAFHAIRNVVRSVRFLVAQGPPFMGPGVGCAMRFVVGFLAVVLVPTVGLVLVGALKDFGINWQPNVWLSPVWVIFGLLVISELTTLWFLWDTQSKLKEEGKLPFPDG